MGEALTHTFVSQKAGYGDFLRVLDSASVHGALPRRAARRSHTFSFHTQEPQTALL